MKKPKNDEGIPLTHVTHPQDDNAGDYNTSLSDTHRIEKGNRYKNRRLSSLVRNRNVHRSEYESLSCVPCSNLAKISEAYERVNKVAESGGVSRSEVHPGSAPSSGQRWTTSGCIGFMCGILAFCLKQSIGFILYAREYMLEMVTNENDEESVQLWPAFFILMLFTSVLVVFSSAVIIYGEPRAAGSGIPETSAFLNGVIIPKTFTIRVIIAKFMSCALAVGSGIPAGPEGPMIHMGSVLGSLISQGVCMPRFMKDFLRPFHNVCDRRDFMGAGVAGGVAAAFSAPIGGLLFVAEEIATHWDVNLGMQIFFCAIVACTTVEVLMSSFSAFHYIGGFGIIKEKTAILFAVNKEISVNIIMFIPTIILGIIGGLFGVIFNMISVRASAFRAKHIKPYKCWYLLEPILVAAVYSAAVIFIPSFFSCIPSDCSEDPDAAGCSRVGQTELEEDALIRYQCPANTYNPAASLYLTSGEEAVKHLYWRGSHYQYDYLPLLAMLFVYLPASAYANGLACSTGIVVPCLLNGALIGRIFGLLVTDIYGYVPDDPNSEWIDPGSFALIGSAAFFAGVARITMALTVILTEISDDSNYILPIMVSIISAKWTADWTGNHPIYHALQGLKGLPVLPSHPHVHAPMECFTALQVATENVITMPIEVSVKRVIEILRTTTHNAYPVTLDTENGPVFVGLILREYLVGLIKSEASWSIKGNKAKMRWHTVKVNFVSKLKRDQLEKQELLAFDNPDELQDTTEKGMLIFKAVSSQAANYYVNLKPYIDTSSFTVCETFSLKSTYVLFTSMGLRHIVVVDAYNRIRGIITRHNLLEENLKACVNQGNMVHPTDVLEHAIFNLSGDIEDSAPPSSSDYLSLDSKLSYT